MRTTRVFKSGNSLAVRLPKDFQINSEEVEIYRRGKEIVIREIPQTLAEALKDFPKFSDDFFSEGRQDNLPQERDLF